MRRFGGVLMFEEKNEVLDIETTEQILDSDLNRVEQALEVESMQVESALDVEDASVEIYESIEDQLVCEVTEASDLHEINLGYDETFEEESEQREIVIQQEELTQQGYSKLKGKTIEELESFYNSLHCDRRVGVYVKTNAQGYIIDVKSDIFEKNLEGYIKIDEGDGDRYIHAQTCYFEEPLSDESGHYRYKL